MVRVARPPRYPRWKVGKHGADVRRPDVSDLMITVGNEHIGNFGHLLGPLRRDRRQDAQALLDELA